MNLNQKILILITKINIKVANIIDKQMKNYKNELVCAYHKSPITKIDKISKKLLCVQCQQQSPQQFKSRIEVMRAKLNTNFTQQLAKLKAIKTDVDKVSEMFLNHNMVDAKRKIKKQLPVVQNIIDSIIDKQVQEANKILKQYTQKILKPWAILDNRKFDIAFLQFQKAYPDLIQQIQQKKKELKEGIANKIKIQVAGFYCRLFDL